MKSGARIVTYKVVRSGEDIIDYHNTREPVRRDATIARLLPDKVVECNITRAGNQVCMRRHTIEQIARASGIRVGSDEMHILRELMRSTGCNDERCVLRRAREMNFISREEAGIEELLSFKQTGPTDTSLLSDAVIDTQLYAWMYQFTQFWAYNFNMLNWREKKIRSGRIVNEPDTMMTINWADLYRGELPNPVGMHMTEIAQQMMTKKRAIGIRYSACVINSDVYDGSGKHWMALFVDARDKSESPTWTIEFFNSAAVRPRSEWLDWMSKTREELLSVNPRAKVEYVYVCRVWHQHSKTECGPYTLFYIWSRINSVPYGYFMENPVPDQIVLEFRQHLFNESAEDRGKDFDFAQYSARVNVKWDRE